MLRQLAWLMSLLYGGLWEHGNMADQQTDAWYGELECVISRQSRPSSSPAGGGDDEGGGGVMVE